MTERSNSDYINMRKSHNKIKFNLIKTSVLKVKRIHEKVNILDISIGRFGDMHNYSNSGVDYILGIDPDEKSIEEAKKRLKNFKKLENVDLFVDTISNSEKPRCIGKKKFNIVVCNFTMHYFFEEESMLRNTIKHVSNSLFKGGYFIGTSINGHLIDKQIEETHNKFTIQKLYSEKKIYGSPYIFNLNDLPNSGLYNFSKKEYLVDFDTIKNIASENNLKLISYKPFYKHKRLNMQEWEKKVSDMYFSFVFVKL